MTPEEYNLVLAQARRMGTAAGQATHFDEGDEYFTFKMEDNPFKVLVELKLVWEEGFRAGRRRVLVLPDEIESPGLELSWQKEGF
jgi:hypothetical protein